MNIVKQYIQKAIDALSAQHPFAPHGAGVLGIGALVLLIRKVAGGAYCEYKTDMTGKTIIITGSNTGIGKETARELAKLGATIVVACRDAAKGELAVAEIISTTNNKNIKFMKLDLADLDSVRAFAADFRKNHAKLDILINNAGVMMCPKLYTKQGLELQFGCNHIGHFLLTNLLLDLIVASKGRIINLSSAGHFMFGANRGMNFDDINSEKSYSPYFAYGQSKLANVLFTKELQKRVGKDVTVAAVHPGGVNTELSRHFNPVMTFLLTPVVRLLSKTPLQGAQTTLHCVLKPNLEQGCYFDNCRAVPSSAVSYSEEQQKKLWELSEQITGLAAKK